MVLKIHQIFLMGTCIDCLTLPRHHMNKNNILHHISFSEASYPKITKRSETIDTIRGFLLLLMTLDHLLQWPLSGLSFLYKFSFQPLGLVSAAEGFFLLSGITLSMVYAKYITTQQYAFCQRKIFSRAKELYFKNTFSILLCATLVILFPNYFVAWGNATEFSGSLYTHPKLSIIGGATFTILPAFFDILPLYILFLLASPFVLKQIVSGRVFFTLTAIFGFYLIGQYGPLFLLQDFLQQQGFTPTRFTWFEPLSWQLLFFSGLTLGTLYQQKKLSFLENIPKHAVLTACLIVLFFTSYKYSLLSEKITQPIKTLTDIRTLGPLTLIQLSALTIIFIQTGRSFPKLVNSRALSLLGKNGLEVFLFHCFLCYGVAVFRPQINELAIGLQLTILCSSILSLWLVPLFKYRNLIQLRITMARIFLNK